MSEFDNKLSQAIGTEELIEFVETKTMSLKKGDLFLLSTDGLHDVVDFKSIRDVLLSSQEPNEIIEKLCVLADSAGREDDITIVAAYSS